LTARVALVTGGAAGIGRASALRLAADGVAVAVADVRPPAADLADELERLGAVASLVQCDVTDRRAVDAIVAETTDRLGPIDILVNCAGVLGHEAPVDELEEVEVRRVLEVNFYGVFHCCRAVLPQMRRAGWGRIVAISSHARHECPMRMQYGASKAAVTSLMRSLALETATTGVLVNSIEPGRTLTDMIVPRFSAEHLAAPPDAPIGRYAEPAEIAEMVAYLCSERNSYATGAMFNVSGGSI
jgi:NAD(P)-dependent dehydrogenase (short-subunit alcohol dehydrogenase family)